MGLIRPFDVIFFDLDHTLIDTRKQYKLGMQQTVQQLYGQSAPETFIPAFMAHHARLWSQYDKREITMTELRRERFLRAWRELGVERTPEDAEVFQTAYNTTFETTLFTFDETLDLVQTLAKHHQLGIITNGSPDMQDYKMQITHLSGYFVPEAVTISELVGMAKPHPSVYQSACQQLGVEPANTVMIGDNYAADVEGAKVFGMNAIWYVPDAEMAVALAERVGHQPLTSMAEVLAEVDRLESAR